MGHDLLALGLLLDELEDTLAVVVLVLLGLELGRQTLDQPVGHLDLTVGRFDVGPRQTVELLGAHDLVGEVHRRQDQRVTDRPHRRQVLLGAHHDPGDAHHSGVLHGRQQQAIRLGAPVVGHQVVRAVEEQRVDVVEPDEVLDVDGVRRLGIERLQLLGLDQHIVAGRDFVALDDLVVGDLLVLLRAVPLLVDPGAVRLVQLVEPHVLLAHRGEQLHRHVDQPEADRAAPN